MHGATMKIILLFVCLFVGYLSTLICSLIYLPLY